MRYHHPPSEMGANGYYGGVGSRPATGFWTPGRDEPSDEAQDRVPRRFRLLRLRRTRPRPRSDRASELAMPLVVFIATLAFVAVCVGAMLLH